MPKSLNDILGVSSLPKEKEIPGAFKVEGREFWYVEEDGKGNFNRLFPKILTAISPPIHTSGGAITGGCSLTLPDKRVFHSFSYKGDLTGWREQVVQGANKLGLTLGQIDGDEFKLLDGDGVLLSDCEVDFN